MTSVFNFAAKNILAILRRSVLRVVGPISAAERLGNTATKKRQRGGEP